MCIASKVFVKEREIYALVFFSRYYGSEKDNINFSYVNKIFFLKIVLQHGNFEILFYF